MDLRIKHFGYIARTQGAVTGDTSKKSIGKRIFVILGIMVSPL
jgi:hypothetical protein